MTVTSIEPLGGDDFANEPSFLVRIRLRALRTLRWLDHMWARQPTGLGLTIHAQEAERVLTGSSLAAELAFYASDPESCAVGESLAVADASYALDGILLRLREELELTDPELDLLSLAVAIEADPWLRRAFAYIHDDANATQPTPWLASRLFHWPPGTRIGPEASLVRWRLARPIDTGVLAWSATAGWIADPLVASALIRGRGFEDGLGEAVRFTSAAPQLACLYPEERSRLTAFVRSFESTRGKTSALELVIVGPPGAGKRTLAAQVCAELERPLISVDVPALLGAQRDTAEQRDALVRVIRAARLTGAAVYWHAPDSVCIAACDVAPPPLAIAAAPCGREDVIRRSVELPTLTQAMREAMWSALSATALPGPISEWALLPSDIGRAAAMAHAGPEAVLEACKTTLRIDGATLAAPLPRPFTWDDLVLAPSVRRHLEELEAQARLRWQVYEGWGFGKHFPLGSGIAALFAGPSGTGKTMAAQVLARSLGMELYRVDLAGVISKYIGETEKHLRQLFDACERANVLLFFDEADALFGPRMQVKDAHDRFANIEIDYLLQRMEQFDGIAVLATNRKHEIDSAFLRRVRFVIDFLAPSITERRELWRRALRPRGAAGDELLDGIDMSTLAERLDMTGAEIKSAATSAAFLARAEGARIASRHVLHAARRELSKRGVVVRAGELD